MWVTVPANVRLTEELIAEIQNNHGLKLTGRFKKSGKKYKKIELELPNNSGNYANLSQNDLECLKHYFNISPEWRLRGRK